MDAPSFLSDRLDRAAAPLLIGDLLALMVMLTIGTLNHTSIGFLTANPLYLPGVYAPFLIAWILIAPLVGAYSAGAAETAKSSVPLAVRSWIPAAVLALALRALVFRGGAEVSFAVVMLVAGSVFLGGWRALYFRVR